MLEGSLEQADWSTKRQVIRTLVKQIEIGSEGVKVVYRVDRLPFAQAPERGVLPHCWWGAQSLAGEPLSTLGVGFVVGEKGPTHGGRDLRAGTLGR